MLALPPNPLSRSDSSASLETVIETQDDRWVVIVRHLENARVTQTRMRAFPSYAQARQYEVDLCAGGLA